MPAVQESAAFSLEIRPAESVSARRQALKMRSFRGEFSCCRKQNASGTVSRVLSLDDHLSGTAVAGRLERPTESWRATSTLCLGLASNGVCICPARCRAGGSLLRCHFTLTPAGACAVSFLLHFPWSRLRRTLSGILPCEARTFLSCGILSAAAAIICPARGYSFFYSVIFSILSFFRSVRRRTGSRNLSSASLQTWKQLPPMNSLRIEFVLIFSLGTGST